MSTIQETSHEGCPLTLADQLNRAARRLHAGEEPTSSMVDVMIEASEILKALTSMCPIAAPASVEEGLRALEPVS